MSDENSGGAFWTGFLLGGLVGAAAALLMTPQSGETTRTQLQERGSQLKNQVDGAATGLQERGKVILEERLPSGRVSPEQAAGDGFGDNIVDESASETPS
jgi:gas vesicle protein